MTDLLPAFVTRKSLYTPDRLNIQRNDIIDRTKITISGAIIFLISSMNSEEIITKTEPIKSITSVTIINSLNIKLTIPSLFTYIEDIALIGYEYPFITASVFVIFTLSSQNISDTALALLNHPYVIRFHKANETARKKISYG